MITSYNLASVSASLHLQTGDPTGEWNIYHMPVQNDGTGGTPNHGNGPAYGDYPQIGTNANGFYIATNECKHWSCSDICWFLEWQICCIISHYLQLQLLQRNSILGSRHRLRSTNICSAALVCSYVQRRLCRRQHLRL